MKYFIEYGCGCGDEYEVIEAKSEDSAWEHAHQCAIANYQSFEGYHGIMDLDDVEDVLDNKQIIRMWLESEADDKPLKDCLSLLPKPVKNGNLEYVCLQAVKEMIDKFPKEECGNEYKDTLKKLTELNENNKVNYDILTGKGLSKL